MKVKELSEFLAKQDPELDVWIDVPDEYIYTKLSEISMGIGETSLGIADGKTVVVLVGE